MDKREKSTISKTSLADRDLGPKSELLNGGQDLSQDKYNPASYFTDSHYFPSYGTEPCVNASHKQRSRTSDECIKNGGSH